MSLIRLNHLKVLPLSQPLDHDGMTLKVQVKGYAIIHKGHTGVLKRLRNPRVPGKTLTVSEDLSMLGKPYDSLEKP